MTGLPKAEIRIVSLSQFDQSSTGRVFDEQCREWLSRLRWDYAEPSRLLRGVLSKGELSGLVAIRDDSANKCQTTGAEVTPGSVPADAAAGQGFEGKTAVGFSFYVVEGTRASIGDIYVSPRYRNSGVDKQLITAVLAKLGSVPRLRRIESQSVSFDNQGADEVFMSRAFERFERRFMLAHLNSEDLFSSPSLAGRPVTEWGTVRIRPWREDDYGAAVRTIFRSYRGEDDSRINSQYSSEEGCAELLSILTDTVWCGRFLPEASRVAACNVTGNQVGVLISSRMSPDTAHLGQISVLPAYQGRGIGRALIQAAKSELCKRGFDCASLAVTATNKRAVSLYESCGFSTIHSFPVYYWRRR